MPSSIEVKKETEAKLLEANANEKYLYSRVTELEKRNQKLEKKVKKLKMKKKELKQEVAKLRGKIQAQGLDGVGEATGQDEDQGVSKRTLGKNMKISPLLRGTPLQTSELEHTLMTNCIVKQKVQCFCSAASPNVSPDILTNLSLCHLSCIGNSLVIGCARISSFKIQKSTLKMAGPSP